MANIPKRRRLGMWPKRVPPASRTTFHLCQQRRPDPQKSQPESVQEPSAGRGWHFSYYFSSFCVLLFQRCNCNFRLSFLHSQPPTPLPLKLCWSWLFYSTWLWALAAAYLFIHLFSPSLFFFRAILASVLKPLHAIVFRSVSFPASVFQRRPWFKKPASPAYLDQFWEQCRFHHDFTVFCASQFVVELV